MPGEGYTINMNVNTLDPSQARYFIIKKQGYNDKRQTHKKSGLWLYNGYIFGLGSVLSFHPGFYQPKGYR
ncbi:hypothetical protein GCM10027566_08000 [Arachidicoccus ginsenosidivorans]